jgi:hypothetical protein
MRMKVTRTNSVRTILTRPVVQFQRRASSINYGPAERHDHHPKPDGSSADLKKSNGEVVAERHHDDPTSSCPGMTTKSNGEVVEQSSGTVASSDGTSVPDGPFKMMHQEPDTGVQIIPLLKSWDIARMASLTAGLAFGIMYKEFLDESPAAVLIDKRMKAVGGQTPQAELDGSPEWTWRRRLRSMHKRVHCSICQRRGTAYLQMSIIISCTSNGCRILAASVH